MRTKPVFLPLILAALGLLLFAAPAVRAQSALVSASASATVDVNLHPAPGGLYLVGTPPVPIVAPHRITMGLWSGGVMRSRVFGLGPGHVVLVGARAVPFVVVGAPIVAVGAPGVAVGGPNVVVGAPGVVVAAPPPVVVGAPAVVVGVPGVVVAPPPVVVGAPVVVGQPGVVFVGGKHDNGNHNGWGGHGHGHH
jgi:hypothetical protein